MARINKSELTKLEIIRVATQKFLENGYSATGIKELSRELEMSPGNITFYFPTKEHLLAELVDLMCRFQWKMIEHEANEGVSSVMAICLELTLMAAMCEENEVARNFYLSSYTSPLCLEIIRKNDARRAKEVFAEYCADWSEERFEEAELLVSGIEYATLMKTSEDLSLEARISGALNQILTIYGVPEQQRKTKVAKALATDYRKLGGRVFREFKKFVNHENEDALMDLLKR